MVRNACTDVGAQRHRNVRCNWVNRVCFATEVAHPYIRPSNARDLGP